MQHLKVTSVSFKQDTFHLYVKICFFLIFKSIIENFETTKNNFETKYNDFYSKTELGYFEVV